MKNYLILLKKNKIGIPEIVKKDPLTIRIYECISCSGVPKINKPLCHFEGGFIAGVLEKIYNKPINLKETHCAGLGDNFCQFRVR